MPGHQRYSDYVIDSMEAAPPSQQCSKTVENPVAGQPITFVFTQLNMGGDFINFYETTDAPTDGSVPFTSITGDDLPETRVTSPSGKATISMVTGTEAGSHAGFVVQVVCEGDSGGGH